MKIYHGKIVTPDQIIEQGTLTVEDGAITAIDRKEPDRIEPGDIDAKGSWVMPGIIDSHSDAIEIEMEPRPTSKFPIDLSFFELEKKLASEGITTIFHAVSLMKRNTVRWPRQNETVFELIDDINRLAKGSHLIRHKTHLRYEIANVDAAGQVAGLIREGKIDELSLTDHTPGQGQYRDLEVQRRLLVGLRHYSEQEADEIIRETMHQAKLDPETIRELAYLAFRKGIPVASHDDDTLEKLEIIHGWKASISEFPITLEVARSAKDMGLFVVMGAPNLLLGKSHSNNLSAREAVREGLVDMMCSDYYPSSLLHAVFELHYELGMTLPHAVNMVTLNPARAMKLNHILGSIETGKKADLLIVAESGQKPVLQTVIVDGKKICELSYLDPEHVDTFAE
ncbi:phosphonate metabolism protein PhnM [Sporolactobacillus shoreae]|uniref:Phosphonate metabolism protein PhnM n=1 Tax=Sporolactobacillus shoreae TaxID=1465501 RepID=A0A4Z0GHA0_9BACL|nr:phosphonate metabolism protein PhnM [Sporolactobacillus shoreae]TGA96030.1 phosphonate metabolism protein PhnM [Sporolactobacillus shoreae]